MNSRRALTRPIISQIVDIHAVDHVRDAPLASQLVKPGKQFVLAVETAVGTVFDVIRILKLARLDVFVPESVLARMRASTDSGTNTSRRASLRIRITSKTVPTAVS